MKAARNIRQIVGLILAALLFGALLLGPAIPGLSQSGQRAFAVALLMACFWITEAIPIYATALLPLVLFPILGVLKPAQVSAPYGDRIVFLMLGGFLLAAAMQKWNLHKRVALFIIHHIGTSPGRLVLGFMVATAVMSMWMSNSATAVMMVPIATSVLSHIPLTETDSRVEQLGSALMLGIAYAASIGGMATLVGTPPNAIFAGQIKALFPQAPDIFFDSWMLLGLPISAVMLITAWLLITRLMLCGRGKKRPGDRKNGSTMTSSKNLSRATEEHGRIENERNLLRPIGMAEKVVLTVFVVTAFLWITRRLWSTWLPIGVWVHDSTIAMAAGLILFLIPVKFRPLTFALQWECATTIPWGVLLLFGGGFALAAGLQQSGLAAWVGSLMDGMHGMHPLVSIFVVCLLMTFLTEITMNTSTTTVMMPILAYTASSLSLHPFVLMVPATLSASCAFMLPSATPPNAIVFSSSRIRLPLMAKTGFVLNLLAIIIISLLTYCLAGWAFGTDLSTLPAWATPSPT